MSLTRQIFLYSVATDAFYEPQEKAIHNRLLKLYQLRQKLSPLSPKKKPNKFNRSEFEDQDWFKKSRNWRKSALNRVIRSEKAKLTELLDARLINSTPRKLDPSVLTPKSVISLFESSLTRAMGIETNNLTEDLFVLNVFFFQVFENLVKDGFLYKGQRYVFLTASAGQIRTKKAVFIRESLYEEIQPKIMCGLTVRDINDAGGINSNKFLAYLALANSATDVWEDFDIDKAIVVDDFETEVPGEVDHIDGISYKITRRKEKVKVPHMDGCGIMLNGPTRMTRLPWIKGLLVQFPFDDFVRKRCPDGKCIVVDIYGDEHDVLGEGIEYIFTKSQFKLAKYYNSWQEYKDAFKEYGCEACYCNLEEEYIPKSRINYQMLQTLSDITDDEIHRLIDHTVEEIDKIGNDYQTTMRLLGATEYNKSPSYFQEALMIYPELIRDQYCREILKQTKKSLIKQAKAGRLRVNGKYLFVAPDIYAFCEWLFLGEQEPNGLLNDGEVYTKEFCSGDELACLRSPHLYREWAVKTNKRDEELDRWFGKSKCVYTSCHDLISKVLQFDCDGDKLLIIKDRLLTKIAKRNMEGIVPLAYDLKKAQGGILTSETMYQGMTRAYTGGNIGPISNNISKIFNLDEVGQEQLNVVKWLCFQNNAVIDFAKTLWLPTPPKDIAKIIRSYTKAKVPNFFIYAKDKLESQVEPRTKSTMNRISEAIPDTGIKFAKFTKKFDYHLLTNKNVGFSITNDNPIVKSYDYWNNRKNFFNEQDDNIKDQDLYKYHLIRQKIIEENGGEEQVDYIVNSLVLFLYTMRPNSTKKTLWACFGLEMLVNLRENLKDKGRVCRICGTRFEPTSSLQTCCSRECWSEWNRKQAIERKSLWFTPKEKSMNAEEIKGADFSKITTNRETPSSVSKMD